MRRMKVKCSLILILLGLTSNVKIKAQNMRDPFKEIERTQRLLEMRQQQEYINNQLNYPLKGITEEKEEEQFEIEEGQRFKFVDIQLLGSNVLRKQAEKIINEYVNTEMGKKEIFELLSKLSNLYLENGYTTTLVTLKSGNTNEGRLLYEVKEGKLDDIKIMDKEKKSFLDRARIWLAYPLKKGDLVNLRDMDQGIENMNIGGYNNVAEINPTDRYGYSDIIIEEAYYSTGFSIGGDNSGYMDKGRNKVNMNFSQANLLGINDTLSLNYIERLTKVKSLDKESNYDLGYSVPFGYWKFAYSFNLGDNFNTAVSDIGSYKTISKSKKHKIKLSRILSRGQYHKTTVHGGLVLKDNRNIMNDLLLESSTKKYTSMTFAIDHADRFLGGTIFTMLEYERGVPWFGGESDPPIQKSTDYKVEYDKININLDWMKDYAAGSHNFQYRMSIGGTYSSDRLLSANQFTMGDEFTIRGFKESSVAGNKGIYVSNTVSYLGSEGSRVFSIIKPFIGLDGGVSRDMDLPNSDKLVGFALGFRASYRGVNTGFTYGVPLRRALGMPKEKTPIYFNLSYNF